VINRAAEEQEAVIPPHLERRLRQAYAEPNRRLGEMLEDFPLWSYEE
jgi:formate dehydrogenase maturation protein FdhE